jgi:hypothetical protein
VATLTENLVLGEEHTVDTAHEGALDVLAAGVIVGR